MKNLIIISVLLIKSFFCFGINHVENKTSVLKSNTIINGLGNIFFSANNCGLELDQQGYAYKNGKHYLVWSNGRYSSDILYSSYDNYVKLSISTDGVNWTTNNIIPTSYGSYNHRIAIDNNDKVHITYTDITQTAYYGSYNAQVVYATNMSGNWVKQTVADGTGNYTFYASDLITVNQSGIVSVFYHSDCWWVYGSPLLVKKINGSTWGNQIVVSNNGTRNLYDDRENILKTFDYENGKLVLYVSSGFQYERNIPSTYSNKIYKIVEDGDNYTLSQTFNDARDINVSNGKLLRVSADQKSLYLDNVLVFSNNNFTIEKPSLNVDGTYLSFSNSNDSYILKKIGSNYQIIDTLLNHTSILINNEIITKSALTENPKTVYIDSIQSLSLPISLNTVYVITPGTLNTTLTTEQKDTITYLTVIGNIDVRDIYFMRSEMKVLTDINLKNANIIAYNGIVTSSATFFNETHYYPSNEMPQNSFYNTNKLKTIVFPASLTSIGANAFGYCSSLSGLLTFPSLLVAIGDEAFIYCNGISGSINLPNTLKSVGVAAFSNCINVSGSLTIPATVSFVGHAAFSRCKISNFIVQSGNTRYINGSDGIIYTIQKDTIIICPGAKTGVLTILPTVKHIGFSAFYGCTGITGKLVIPNTVTSMDLAAFSYCTGISSVTLPNSISSIENSAFWNCDGITGTILIPSSITNIHDNGFYGCNNLENFVVEKGNSRFSSKEGVIYSYSGDSVKICPPGKTGIVKISNKVTAIDQVSFSNRLKISNLYVDNTNPANILLGKSPASVFSTITKTCILLVLKGSLAVYKATPYWNEFSQIFEVNNILVHTCSNGEIVQNNISLSKDTSILVISDSTKTFKFIPNSGYEISTLTYNGVDVKSQLINNQYTTPPVTTNGTLNVTFVKSVYKISVQLGGSGTMNLNYYYGDTPSFDFTPSQGAKIQSVFYNGVDVTADLVGNVYTLTAITANGTLKVVFVSNPTGVNATIDSGIYVFKSGSEIFVKGTSAGEQISLFSVDGRLLQTIKSTAQGAVIQVQTGGTYLIRIKQKTYKVLV